jgi:amino acid transporter
VNFVETAIDPWRRTVLTHVAWNILWVSAFVLITFPVAHASYIILSAHRVRDKDDTDALETKHADLPHRIRRHSCMARLFHWVMAGAVFTLLGTAVFPPNPYILGEATWGWVSVLHGLVGLSLAGLSVAHVVFGARPKHWWLTRSMIVGWLTRREYLEHHEPARWPIKTRMPKEAGDRRSVRAPPR